MPDLDDPAQIAELVRRFYAEVAQDDLLGPMFEDVAGVDWSEHLPKLTAFWCRALLGQVGYAGNPYRAHTLVHARSPFTAPHFERWLEHFADTIDAWSGPNVERALELVADVARVHSRQLLGEAVAVRVALGRVRRADERGSIDLRSEPGPRSLPTPESEPEPETGGVPVPGPTGIAGDDPDLDGLERR